MTSLTLYTPAGALEKAAPLRLAAKRLARHGYDVQIDPAALLRHQRFAGSDDDRLASLHRIATEAPSIAMATRGGYGTTRLLERIDWPLVARSIERGTRWVGHSDLTALQLGVLAQAGSGRAVTWCGPMAVDDFGRAEADGGVDDVTEDCFLEAMHGQLEAIGFRTDAGFDGLQARGLLWGGNLCMVCSLLGTPYFPPPSVTDGGVMFLEDVAEHPYRIERSLLQLHHAGVLARQSAVVLGAFSAWRKVSLDRGYDLKAMVAHLRSVTSTPILTGLPFGHVPTKVTMPVGMPVRLTVQRRDALIAWA